MGLYNPAILNPVIIERQGTSNASRVAYTSSHPSNTEATHLLEINVNRKAAVIFNASTASLFIQFGSMTENVVDNCAVKIAPQGYYEIPINYIGEIDGIWDAVDGSAKIVEFV